MKAKEIVRSVLHWISVGLLLAGFCYYCYGLYAGAGLSGWLSRWQLESRGALAVGIWEAVSLGVLVIVPLVFVTQTAKASSGGRPGSLRPMAIFFSIVAGLISLSGWAYWMGVSGPDIQAAPQRLDVNQAAAPREGMVSLAGHAQNQFVFRYAATRISGRGSTSTAQSEWRSYIPVTGAGWKQGDAIRFFLASNQYELGPGEIPPGVLLRSPLPWYLRSLMEAKGIRFAEPYYVVDTSAYLAVRGNWDAIAAISGFFGLVALFFFLVFFWPFKDLRRALGLRVL